MRDFGYGVLFACLVVAIVLAAIAAGAVYREWRYLRWRKQWREMEKEKRAVEWWGKR